MSSSHTAAPARRDAMKSAPQPKAVLVACSRCDRPIVGNAAVCHFCAWPRNGVLAVRLGDRPPSSAKRRPQSAFLSWWLGAKIACVAAASVVAAAVLWYHQYGEIELEWTVFKGILLDAQTTFSIGVLLSFVPRSAGLLLALLLVGTRTYVAWHATGAAI